MIKVALLADYSEVVPTLAYWIRAQWPDYYVERTQADISQDFHSEANRHGLTVRLVAFLDEDLAGTIVLHERAFEPLPIYTPGLGGLFVTGPYRQRGIGSELIRAGMNVAREQGYETVYATTAAAGSLVENPGWELVSWMPIDTVPHGQERLAQ
jgi:GNAT superfamily N-acetyltransferase